MVGVHGGAFSVPAEAGASSAAAGTPTTGSDMTTAAETAAAAAAALTADIGNASVDLDVLTLPEDCMDMAGDSGDLAADAVARGGIPWITAGAAADWPPAIVNGWLDMAARQISQQVVPSHRGSGGSSQQSGQSHGSYGDSSSSAVGCGNAAACRAHEYGNMPPGLMAPGVAAPPPQSFADRLWSLYMAAGDYCDPMAVEEAPQEAHGPQVGGR